MPFFNLLLGLAWLVFAVLLFLDWQWNMGFIPGIPADSRPLFMVVALALLAHNLVRWWMLRARRQAEQEEVARSRRRPTPAKVVDPTFRFNEEEK